MKIETIAWKAGRIKIIDQTKLPNELIYIFIKDVRQLFQAIRSMKIRGAPTLAAAGALGVVLAAYRNRSRGSGQFKKQLQNTINYLGRSRPTAVNLFWALNRMQGILNKDSSIDRLKSALLKEAREIIEEDRANCRRMGRIGARLISDGDKVLTLCNAGILATIDYGTALGVFYQAKKQGRRFKVFACETRPLLQGARLTSWELKKNGIDVSLICDNLAASLMRRKQINKVFVGADRIARNGDVANKVGTYNLAVLANWHRIPFYVVAPLSTFDSTIKTGRDIPIEERSPLEVTHSFFKKPIAPAQIKVLNPAFDVTPHQLITAIVTEKGILKIKRG
ncbi:MAG: S-methyl-5-thioribose-1-phosphate isomerase [Candidatus Aminicenantes bacterium]|nr:S-methyl-5-thioribose-1-phosphate isomerase [Candidatus Aminicenantes bacterium]